MKQISLDGISVMIAMPAKGDIPWKTARSLVATVATLARRGIDYTLLFQVDGNIEYSRSVIAHQFLQSEHHRLFWLDADMEWTPDDFLRILALSMRMDIVGGVYVARSDPPRFIGMNFPQSIGVTEDTEVKIESNEWGCLEATGFGIGFTCCSRYAVQKISDSCELVKFALVDNPIPHPFACMIMNGEFMGEDISFFHRARQMGIKVWFDPNITLGHVGSKTYSGSFRELMAAEQQAAA